METDNENDKRSCCQRRKKEDSKKARRKKVQVSPFTLKILDPQLQKEYSTYQNLRLQRRMIIYVLAYMPFLLWVLYAHIVKK